MNIYPHLQGLPLADFNPDEEGQMQIQILIGAEAMWNIMTGKCIRGELGPVALESKLGWVLSGNVPGISSAASTQANLIQTHVLRVGTETYSEITLNSDNKEPLENMLSKFWELESIGVSCPDENSVYEEFVEDVRFVDGRYEVKLPWKKDHPSLPDNYKLSLGHLNSLRKKLSTKPEILKEYDEIIQEQERRGIVEKVEPTEESPIGKTHYIPHQPVVKQDRTTTKLRIVYDASAKQDGQASLNDCLDPGPCLLHNVAEILTRLRFYKTALTSDIEKAFLMISIQPNERDALRFLWFDDINEDNPKVIPMRFKRVIFGVSSSPFLLNATLDHHIRKYEEIYPEVTNKLFNALYVDDVTTGAYDEEECMKIYTVSKKLLSEGGFNLRKWRTNSSDLQSKINADEINY